MKLVERTKAQKLIYKIQTGNFDENDIDQLFIKLRAYSSEFFVFREIADFVAHPDKREKGLANQALETMYLRVKFFLEYNSPNKTLDLSAPFPLWIKRLMLFQVDKCDEASLRDKFKVTKQCLKSRINKGFKDDKKNAMAFYEQGKLSQDTVNAIQHVMSFINANASFNQKDLIKELLGVLAKNKLSFDNPCLQSLSNEITVCTLLLFHKAEFFDSKKHKLGHCEIAPEKDYSYSVLGMGADGNEVEHHETFGKLSIIANVTLINEDKDITISHCIMSTDLDTEEWCSESLFHTEPLSEQVPNLMCKRIKLDIESLDDKFKLIGGIA